MRDLEVIDLVFSERERAEQKHPDWPEDQIHASAIVAEEAGEAVKAALDFQYHGGSVSALETELAHTAAVAIRALTNLPREPIR